MLERVKGHDETLKDPMSEAAESVQAEWMDSDEKRIYRAIKPEVLIVVASCTHLGCIPLFQTHGWTEGLGRFRTFRLGRWLALPVPRFLL